jgi:hypothetical protein
MLVFGIRSMRIDQASIEPWPYCPSGVINPLPKLPLCTRHGYPMPRADPTLPDQSLEGQPTMTQERLSHAAEIEVPRIEYDITPTLVPPRHGRCGCRFPKPTSASADRRTEKYDRNAGWHHPNHIAKLRERHRGRIQASVDHIPAWCWITTSPPPRGRS